MKRVIIAFVMLSLAVTVAAVSSVTVDKNIKSIISDIDILCNNLKEYETQQIKEKTDIIYGKWLKTEKTLKLVSILDKILPINEKFKQLNSADTSNKNELTKSLNDINILLEIFLSSEDAVFTNIF